MKLTDFAGHIGIPVSNIATSERFYQDVGFSVVERHNLESGKGGNNHIAFLAFGKTLVELYQLDQEPVAGKAGAIHHFAIGVESLAEVKANLAGKGIPLAVPDTNLPFSENGVTYIMIEGPNGEMIEFDQFK
ncbi:VOC family protein [Vibrio owensii]|uniref:VOC family protein n=1 Tax=Vibrio owensii TaxID=696485 RepID=UPI0038CEB067